MPSLSPLRQESFKLGTHPSRVLGLSQHAGSMRTLPGHSRQAGGRRDSIKRQVAWRNHQSHVRGSQRLEPHTKGIFGNFSNPSFIHMFAHHQQPVQWCSVVLFAAIRALTVEKQYAMKFVVAFSLVAKHRSQSQNAISAHEYSCKALVVSSQQQAITVMTISQPLLFAGV